MPKIAACYIRVSTDRQAEYSPESQLVEIKRYAEQNEYYIPDEYVFTDEGIPGKKAENRPAFNKMISVAKSKPKPFDAVLLWKFSRFARNKTEAVVYKSLLRNQCGIDVISVSENIGEDRGTAVILESMFEAMDEYYSINLSTEVKRSMKLKAENGQPLCPAPFGYINENKGYAVDPAQAEIVRYIFDEYNTGTGIRRIAVDLGKMGVKTKRGNVPDNRFVEYILRNPVYIGKIRWNPNGRDANRVRYRDPCEGMILVDGTHEPIISAELFDSVQKRLEAGRQKYGRYQRKESQKDWMLRGLLRCGDCGATLVMTSTKEPGVQCHNYARGQCHVSHNISIKKANQTVIQALENAALTLNFDVEPRKKENPKSDISAINKMIESEKKRLQKVKDAYELGVDTLEEYRENKARINDTLKKLQAELEKAEPKVTISKEAFARKIRAVAEYVKDPKNSEDAKNDMLRTVVSKIVFNRPGNSFDLYFWS